MSAHGSVPSIRFTIRDFASADYPALTELQNSLRPDSTFTPEEVEREDRTLPEPCRMMRIVAEVDGAMVGAGLFDQNPGSYDPSVYSLDVLVAPEHRRKGIGRRLHERLVELLVGERITKRLGRLRSDDTAATAFAETLGYREIKRDVMSALDLAAFDPLAWRGAVRGVEAQGIRICSLAEIRGRDKQMRAFYEAFSSVRADAPRALPATPIEYPFFVEEVVEHPEAFADGTILAWDGERCVGLTQLYRSASSPDVHTGLSGVDRAHRRKGIATALKAKSLEAAKAAGAPRVFTDNDVRNTGMLAVNHAFGFVPRPARVTVAWTAMD